MERKLARAAYGRVIESIDLIAAYPQVVLGGDINHIIIPNCLKRVMPEERALTSCDVQCASAELGFARGRDFIMSFAGWLMNRWLTVPAQALYVLWHDWDDAGAIKRADRSELDEMCW